MDDQLAAVRNAINALDDVDKITTPGAQQKDIAGKLDVFFTQLNHMHSSGSDNYFPVPLDALKFLDDSEDISNPWLYTHKQVENATGEAQKLAAREEYLKGLNDKVSSFVTDKQT